MQMFLNFSSLNTNSTISHEGLCLHIWYHNLGYQFLVVHNSKIKELWMGITPYRTHGHGWRGSPGLKSSSVFVSADSESPTMSRTSSRASQVPVFRITLWLRRNVVPGAARKPIEDDLGALKLSRLQWTQWRACNNDLILEHRKAQKALHQMAS